jgi:hypothetical protein
MPKLRTDYQNDNGEKTEWFEVLPAQLLSTATRTSQEFTMKARGQQAGMAIVVVTANEAGTASFTPELATVVAGADVKFWTAAAAITTDTTSKYLIYPGAGTNALYTEIKSTPIPRTWKLILTYAGTPATDKIDTKVYACYL